MKIGTKICKVKIHEQKHCWRCCKVLASEFVVVGEIMTKFLGHPVNSATDVLLFPVT